MKRTTKVKIKGAWYTVTYVPSDLLKGQHGMAVQADCEMYTQEIAIREDAKEAAVGRLLGHEIMHPYLAWSGLEATIKALVGEKQGLDLIEAICDCAGEAIFETCRDNPDLFK